MAGDDPESVAHDTWLAAERQFGMATDIPVPIMKSPPSPNKAITSPTAASFVLFPHQVGSKSIKSLPPPSFSQAYSMQSMPSSPVHRRTPHVASLQPAGRWSRWVSDTWVIELLAAFMSCAAIVSIIGILGTYDRQPMPPMSSGITPNAVISFLSTISRVAIMLCIASVLSQGKWLWFRKEKSLADFQTIDDASRGPLGALRMLLKLAGGALLYVAALLTIATLCFDPFLQQALTMRTLVVPEWVSDVAINAAQDMTTNIYRAMDYSVTHSQLSAAMLAGVQQQEDPMQVMAGPITPRDDLLRPSDATMDALISPLQMSCTSGSCVWRPYYTLDICTKCRSITTELNVTNLTPSNSSIDNLMANMTKRDGSLQGKFTQDFTWQITPKFGQGWLMPANLTMFVDSSNAVPQMQAIASLVHKAVWPLNFDSSDGILLNTSGWSGMSFAGIEGPVAAIGFAEFDLSNQGLPELADAYECALTYCVNSYNRSVVQGELVSQVLETFYGNVSGDPNVESGLTWSALVNGTNYTVDATQMYGAGIGTLAGYLLGNSTHTYTGLYNISSASGITLDVSDAAVVYNTQRPDSWKGIDFNPNFTSILAAVSDIGSQVVQQYGNLTITGGNAIMKPFLFVRWAWIALPLGIVMIGLGIFLWTVYETYRQQLPIWKASVLPLIYRYVPVDGNEANRNTALFTHDKKGGKVVDSDMVSRFEMEAFATKTNFARSNSAFRVWQLESNDVVHEERASWYSRFKMG